jgi:hypothetical protein
MQDLRESDEAIEEPCPTGSEQRYSIGKLDSISFRRHFGMSGLAGDAIRATEQRWVSGEQPVSQPGYGFEGGLRFWCGSAKMKRADWIALTGNSQAVRKRNNRYPGRPA